MADELDQHVQVKFFTKQKQYSVPDTQYTLSVKVNRQQLTDLINSILAESSEEPPAGVKFDFFVDGELILSTLSKLIANKEISAETVLEIEYVESQAAPRHEESLEHDDWVSAIRGRKDFILSGSYDNTARLWSTKGEAVATIPGHARPIKCVAWIKHDESDPVSSFVTGSMDQGVLVWQWNRDSNDISCCLSCRGHASTVLCVAVNPTGEQMCTGSWDKMLKLWSTDCTFVEEATEADRPRKKKKSGTSSMQTRVPLLTLSGHDQAVTGVQWLDSHRVVTSSWDHSLRIWDLQTAEQTSLLPGTKAFMDVSYSSLSHLLVTASCDRHVRLFDPRTSEGVVVKCAFTSHTGWVSGVDWSPTREHLFLSGSYDGVSKLWDTRSPKAPLFDLKRHEDKILAVDWSVPELMMSGGADNQLHIFSYKPGSV